jgi:PAS domain S-box-containing protein
MGNTKEFLAELGRRLEKRSARHAPGGAPDFQALLERIEELEAVQAFSPAGHLILSRRGVILRANVTAHHLFRHYHRRLLGRRLYDFVPPDRRDDLFLHLRRAWKTGRPQRLELPLKRRKGAEGRHTWVRLDSRADTRKGGTETVISVNLIEVTEERRLNEKIRKERARLHTVLEQMPAGVVMAEAETGRVTLHNRMAEELLGEFPVVETFSEYEKFGIIHPDGTPYRWDEYPMARAIREGAPVHQSHLRLPGPEGDVVFSVSAAPIRDENGAIFAGVLSFHDITGQLRAEAEQARLAAIVNSSDDAIIRQELDGAITHWNPAAERIYGYSAAEMVGRHARVLVPEELRGEAARLISHAARGEKIRGLETVRIGRDGRRIDIGLTMTMIPDEAGRPEAVSSIERDITERKQAEIDLWTSRQQLELATTAGEIGLWNCDLLTGEARWSAQLYQMLGLAPRRGPEDVKTFFDFIHPDDRQGTLETLETLLANHDQINFEFRVIRADGRLRWLASRGRVERDADGRALHMRGVNIDVTDRRRAEDALAASREQLELATTAGKVGIWTYDFQAGTCFWNAQLYHLLGVQPRSGPEALDAFIKFIHPDDRTDNLENLERLASENSEFSIEFRVVRADGKVRWLMGRGRVERDESGRAVAMRGINMDVTDRRRAEEALAAGREALARKVRELERSNQELSEFAYAVSHDLKAPLRAVRNYANFLEEDLGDSLGDDARLYMEGMKKAIGQGDRLIRDLLDFSRIRKRGKAADRVKLGPLVAEVRRVLETGPGVEIQAMENTPPLLVDAALLKRVFMNLISNALKFNESEVKRVDIRSDEMSDGRVRISVSDNGIGIGEDYQGQVFRVFQRLHPPSAYEGTGIGLAIVKKAVLAMGGDVRLESTPGEGSTFLLELPREPPSNGENAEEGEGAGE